MHFVMLSRNNLILFIGRKFLFGRARSPELPVQRSFSEDGSFSGIPAQLNSALRPQ